jgi:hypothetical protein
VPPATGFAAHRGDPTGRLVHANQRVSCPILVRFTSLAMGLAIVRLLVLDDFGLSAVALATTSFVIHVNNSESSPHARSVRAGYRPD